MSAWLEQRFMSVNRKSVVIVQTYKIQTPQQLMELEAL